MVAVIVFLALSVMAVVFVNGFTDAVNAVSSVIATKIYTPKKAVLISGIFNFLGVFLFCTFFSNVAKTMEELIGLNNYDIKLRLLGVSIAMLTVVLFATFAWYFGIATSESHGLIGAVSGCNLALEGFSHFSWAPLIKVLYGQLISIAFGFFFGLLFCAILKRGKGKNEGRKIKISMAFLSFLHGGQDGQKFFALLLLLTSFFSAIQESTLRLGFVVIIALLMGIGTFLGGKRIIDKVENLSNLDKQGWLASDFATVVGVGFSTLLGSPISTTYVKISAIAGSATAKGKSLNKKSMAGILISWFITFPVCFALAFVLVKLLVKI